MHLAIVHIAPYERPETYRYDTLFVQIGLCLSGLDYMRFPPADLELTGKHLPFLTLIPAGVCVDFRFDRHRENWVIQCRLPELSRIPNKAESLLEYGETQLLLPFFLPLTVAQSEGFRDTYAKIRALWQGGTPSGRLAAELLTAGIVGAFTAGKEPEAEEKVTPEARLRELIDGDTGFSGTLAELCREAGWSTTYLRRKFREAYLIDPGEYRARKRLGKIMTLIEDGRLGQKEIANEVGMKHVTHLHSFVKERSGVTPGELMKQFRR